MQTVYRRVVLVVEWSGLDYEECLEKSGSGSGVEWTGVCGLFTEDW